MTKTITLGLTMMALAAGGCMAGYAEGGYDEIGYADEELSAAVDCECEAGATSYSPAVDITCWNGSPGIRYCHRECDTGTGCNAVSEPWLTSDGHFVSTLLLGQWSTTLTCTSTCDDLDNRRGWFFYIDQDGTQHWTNDY